MTAVEYQIILRDKFSPNMNKASRSVGQFNKRQKESNVNSARMRKQTAGLGASMGRLGKMMGTAGLLIGVVRLGSSIVKLGADMEQTKVSFETMLGSRERANKLVSQINEFANVTPFQNDQLFENAKLLLNFGMTGEKVIPTMKMLGDISGGNAQKMQSLTLAYSQARSAGKLMGQDLLQMINAGFNPLQEISRTTGESMASLKKKMAAGRISVQQLDGAFRSATSEGGRFYKMMEKQSKTLAGRWSTLMGKIKMIGIGIGSKLLPILGKAIDFVSKFMESAKKNFHKIKKVIDPIILQFKKVKEAVVKLFKQIFKSNRSLSTASKRWDKFAKLLKIIMTPLRVVGWLIRKLVDFIRIGVKWFQRMYDKFEGLRKVINALLWPFKKLIQAFKWINRQLDQADKIDRLAEIQAKLVKVREEMNKPFITLAKKDSLKRELLMLMNEYRTAMGEVTERQFSWIANNKEDQMEGGEGLIPPGSGADPDITSQSFKVTGAAPKVFNLTISQLVGEFNLNTTNITEASEEVKNTLLKAMMEMIVDIQTNVQ